MTRRPLSIRSRLLLLLSTATVSVWAVAVAMSYWDARRELNELFDAQLAESAEVLLLQAAHDLGDDDESRERSNAPFDHGIDHPYAQQLHFQIWNGEGRLAYQSSKDLPAEPLVTGVSSGYADRTLHGVRWRVAVVTDPTSRMQIQLCQRYDARAGVAGAIARNMFLPVAAAVPILAVLVWLATGSGIRPLGRFTRELQERSPDNLDPVEQANLPAELEPVGSALNGLLERLRTRLDLERRFTADASHELRTPLAALKTHAQVALGARTEEGRVRSLSQIVRGTDRMTHLVDQLLTLARVDPGMAESPARFDLAEIVRETTGSLAPMAVDRGVEIEVQAASGATIEGNRSLVATLVRNLVDNAISYSRRGDRVRLLLDRTTARVTLRVIDSGPGLTPEARARAFERFYRGEGVREPGTGLGLSIVKRIAELHGATVTLEEAEGGGLEVTTRFPAH
ncbi:MAG: ATP-binding protein [Thermoanaerobaculia bacterium]